jgi:PhnB protein
MVTSVEPQLWVDRAADAVDFYEAAFGATTLHRVGSGDDIVVRLAIGEARFWVASAGPHMGRLSPAAIRGATARFLLIVEEPDDVHARAVRAGATDTAAVSEEHGWRVGRVVDPFGHEWEIGRPV